MKMARLELWGGWEKGRGECDPDFKQNKKMHILFKQAV